MRGALLNLYAWLVGYRFQECLKDPLDIPSDYSTLSVDLIRSKATTSITATGLFLAFSIAVLVAIMSPGAYARTLTSVLHARWQMFLGVVTITLLYLVIRQERILSMPGQKWWRYFSLFVLLVASLLLFLAGPLVSRSEGAPFSQGVLKPAFTLAGFLTVIASALFQFFAVELYDSAAGWRGGEREAGRKLRFHLAGLASHSYLVGVSFTLLGASLLLVQTNFWIGSGTTLVVLFALVTVSEIERELWERKEEKLHLFAVGWKSGKWREFKLAFVESDGNFYVFGKNLKKDWVSNIRCRPEVRIRVRGRTMDAQAYVLDKNNDSQESITARGCAREKYGWDAGLTVKITPDALPAQEEKRSPR